MRKNIVFLFALVAVFSMVTLSCMAQEKQKQIKTTQEQALALHDKLMASFNPKWETQEPAPSDYPEYYAGAFIDNDNRFVVQVVGNTEAHRATLTKILGSNDFLMESCTYSYRQLMTVMDKIDRFIADRSVPNNHPVVENFSGAMADVFENRVVVTLLKVNDKIIQAFKNDVTDSPTVIFKEGKLLFSGEEE